MEPTTVIDKHTQSPPPITAQAISTKQRGIQNNPTTGTSVTSNSITNPHHISRQITNTSRNSGKGCAVGPNKQPSIPTSPSNAPTDGKELPSERALTMPVGDVTTRCKIATEGNDGAVKKGVREGMGSREKRSQTLQITNLGKDKIHMNQQSTGT